MCRVEDQLRKEDLVTPTIDQESAHRVVGCVWNLGVGGRVDAEYCWRRVCKSPRSFERIQYQAKGESKESARMGRLPMRDQVDFCSLSAPTRYWWEGEVCWEMLFVDVGNGHLDVG